MNNRIIKDFAQRYGARLNFQQDSSMFTTTFNTYSGSMDHYDNDRSRVDIELPLRAFEHMVKMDKQAEEDYQKYKEEARIRKEYPAVADAYNKYKMMLELCK